MQIIVLIIAMIIALYRGGNLKSVPKFKKYWILIFPVLLEIVAIIFPHSAPFFASLSYVGVILFLAANWSVPDLRLVLIGVSMNALVIWVNGGIMPVIHYIPHNLIHHGSAYQYNEYWHGTLTAKTIFPLLADIIYIPYPIPTLLSCGDIFLFSGIVLLIQRLMGVPVKLSKLAGVE